MSNEIAKPIETQRGKPLRINGRKLKPKLAIGEWITYKCRHIKTGKKADRQIWSISCYETGSHVPPRTQINISCEYPVKVLSCWLGKPEYETRKGISGTYKRMTRVEVDPITALALKLNNIGDNSLAIRPSKLKEMILTAIREGNVIEDESTNSYTFWLVRSNDLVHRQSADPKKDHWIITKVSPCALQKPVNDTLIESGSEWREEGKVTPEAIAKEMLRELLKQQAQQKE